MVDRHLQAGPGAPNQQQDSISDLPAFLRQSRTEIQARFLDLEWQQRHRLAAGQRASDPSSKWARLTGDEISARNRYINVEPFASNRIKLNVAQGANDYINASPIVLGNRRYIATQGPKNSNTTHFYRMLAAETSSPAVVVMLTQTHEAGREKCFPYFPDGTSTSVLKLPRDGECEPGFEGTVELLSCEYDASTRSTIRKLLLKTRSTTSIADGEAPETAAQDNPAKEDQWQEKEIHHLLFSGWADFSIPEGENKHAMLQLINLSLRLNSAPTPPPTSSFPSHGDHAIPLPQNNPDSAPQPPASLNPRIVHCSAGVGRSGTFIALDYLLSQLEHGLLDSVADDQDCIAEVVDKLRQQRMMMVQGEEQFIFLYEVLRDAWQTRSKVRAGVDAVNGHDSS